jgi:hypothetical protein
MFNIAVELEPENSQHHFNLGYVNFKGLENYTVALKHLDRAIADFRKGLALARSQNNNELVVLMQENLRNQRVNE